MFHNANTGLFQRTEHTCTLNPCSLSGTFQKTSNLTLRYFAALGGRSDVTASLWEHQSSSWAGLSDIRKSLADTAVPKKLHIRTFLVKQNKKVIGQGKPTIVWDLTQTCWLSIFPVQLVFSTSQTDFFNIRILPVLSLNPFNKIAHVSYRSLTDLLHPLSSLEDHYQNEWI